MKTKNKRNYLKQNGITLIALVVTIVVLLILAGVSLNAIFSENGIINRAKDAQNKMNQATQNDLDSINSLNEWIDGKINGNIGGENEDVTNPYDPNGWTIAYICNNGTWNDTPLTAANGDAIPEGTQIVAKFYATGNTIGGENDGDLPKGEEYKLVIEGNGEMGSLAEENEEKGHAWQTKVLLWMNWMLDGKKGDSVSCITPYITELTICDGITNVGDGLLEVGFSLNKVILADSVINIGASAFSFCPRLQSITIPDSVINVGYGALDTFAGTRVILTNEALAKQLNSVRGASGNLGPAYTVVIANNIAKSTINAKEIAEHPVVYCGREVTGYTCDNSAGISKWKIYHSDGKNIYLIADNYITGEYIPTKDGATMTASTDYTNAYYFNDTLLNKYTGAASITDANITPWLSYLKSSYGGSDNTNENMKATAYLLDTEIWKGFKNSTKAKYAIGAPTLDMFVASYNTRFSRQIEIMAQELGYKFKFEDEDSYVDSDFDTREYLTEHQYKENYANDMWIASPSSKYNNGLIQISWTNKLESSEVRTYGRGIRPLVCLEDGVTLEKQEVNGEIVYNIKQ